MPRRKRIRKITSPPHFKGFSPMGIPQPERSMVLDFEEYEAIRLCDYDLYNHLEASSIMNVSRPTFARIYESARQKVAYAFVQGIPIIFEGGKVYYDSEWFSCSDCGCKFNHLSKEDPVTGCALCGSRNFHQLKVSVAEDNRAHICVCSQCGSEKHIRHGIPCSHAVCDQCHTRMHRKRPSLR